MADMPRGQWAWFRSGANRWYVDSPAEALVARLRTIHFVTAITMFGAAFLLSTLPLIILIGTFTSRRVDSDLSQHMGLNAQASAIVAQLFQAPATKPASAVAIAVLLGAAGTVGVAGSVQSVYEQIFGVPHHGRANVVRLVVWLAGLCAWLVLDSLISTAAGHLPGGTALEVPFVLAATTAFFWWSMRLLLGGRIPWRALFPSAVATAVFWLGLEGFAALYFSSTITSDSRLYGTVGVVFSLLTWFMAIAAVIVLGAAVGAVWHERRTRLRHDSDTGHPDARQRPADLPSDDHEKAAS